MNSAGGWQPCAETSWCTLSGAGDTRSKPVIWISASGGLLFVQITSSCSPVAPRTAESGTALSNVTKRPPFRTASASK